MVRLLRLELEPLMQIIGNCRTHMMLVRVGIWCSVKINRLAGCTVLISNANLVRCDQANRG